MKREMEMLLARMKRDERVRKELDRPVVFPGVFKYPPVLPVQLSK